MAMPVRLDIRHLQMLKVLKASSSMKEAAIKLNITPSALSHRLREAERRLSTNLLYRDQSRITLTLAARRLISAADTILAELENAEKEAELGYRGFDQVVKIGSRANMARRWLPQLLIEFMASDPKTTVEIVTAAAADPLEWLHGEGINLAIVSGKKPSGNVIAKHLFSDELVAVLPKDHPQTKRVVVSAEDFYGDTYITYGIEIEPGHEYDLLFKESAPLPKKMINVGSLDFILEFVKLGYGVSFLMKSAVLDAVQRGDVDIRPLKAGGGLSIDCWAVYSKVMPETAATARLAALLERSSSALS